MCGIVGYVGKDKSAESILLEGLKQLEYRGYDSAGLAIISSGQVKSAKATGKVEKLEQLLAGKQLAGSVGIAHTRWATHGKPTRVNAHPHFSNDKNIYLVHNGIIENYRELKNALVKKGYKFVSETDTEVIAHLISDNFSGDLEQAVKQALKRVQGAYGLAVIAKDDPEKIVVARNGSPLLIGVGDKEKIIASDAAAIIGYTKKVIYLDDGEIAVVTADKVKISDIYDKPIKKKIDTITWNQDEISKGGYNHFMAKEIHEAKEVIIDSIRGRYKASAGLVKLGGLESVAKQLKSIKRFIIVACGTARYAGLVGEYMLEEFAHLPVEVEYASEFRYRLPIVGKDTVVLAISQSGETADTLAAIREAKKQGALTLGIVNVVGSTIARETDAGVYNHIGPEIAVASTKACISQMTILALFTVFLGRQRGMSKATAVKILKGINRLPEQFEQIFAQETVIKQIANKYKNFTDFLYLGRKYNFPMAMEGALKVKEISYIHAEGYPTGEMKHGPIAMIDKNFPTLVIAPSDSVYEKNISGIEEIKARAGKVIVVATEGNKQINKLADEVIYIPESLEMINPILSVVPLQMLAYYIGVGKGLDVDKPRNLAKSVTVE